MKNRNLPIILSFGLLVLFSSCADKKEQAPQQTQPQALPFPVVEVPTKTVTAYTTYPTSIEGIVNSEVRVKISGYITEVLVDEGQKVRKGQVLFPLETQSLSPDAGAAKAPINVAQVGGE